MAIRTVGELRAAMDGLADDTPVRADFGGGCAAITAEARLCVGPKGRRGGLWYGSAEDAWAFAASAWPGEEIEVAPALVIDGIIVIENMV